MKKFCNCEMAAGRVTLKTKQGLATYSVYGFAILEENEDGTKNITLQPADLRCSPVMRIPVENIGFISVDF